METRPLTTAMERPLHGVPRDAPEVAGAPRALRPVRVRPDDTAQAEAHTEPFDRWFHGAIARTTRGISPAALLLAYVDWMAHLALSPAKQLELARKAWRKLFRLTAYATHARSSEEPWCIEPL
jgi:hypothetical protein